MTGAIREAFRYTRNTPNMLTVLGRIAVIMFFASPFWALLPTVLTNCGKARHYTAYFWLSSVVARS